MTNPKHLIKMQNERLEKRLEREKNKEKKRRRRERCEKGRVIDGT